MKVVLKELTKVFASRNKNDDDVVAVDNFDFEIPDGKLVGLLGPSGCGKSTTLNLISGLEKPTQGKIIFGEDDVTELPPELRGVGLVFQNYALYPHLTVEKNIMFPLQNLKGEQKLTKEQMKAKVLEAAKLVQIDSLLDRKPGQMSGGQQQRVAIARALVKTPRVLLLDEPLSNLDARLRLQTREEIKRIQQETGVTTVFVTHDQEEAMSISDLIVVMKDGVVQQIDEPQKVYDNPKNLFVAKFLGTPPINIFEGYIENGKLFIGSDTIFDISCAHKGSVIVGIRPEGFIVDPEGCLQCGIKNQETMGRDSSIIATHQFNLADTFRVIVPAEKRPEADAETVNFYLKENKVFIFDKETEERIPFFVKRA